MAADGVGNLHISTNVLNQYAYIDIINQFYFPEDNDQIWTLLNIFGIILIMKNSWNPSGGRVEYNSRWYTTKLVQFTPNRLRELREN